MKHLLLLCLLASCAPRAAAPETPRGGPTPAPTTTVEPPPVQADILAWVDTVDAHDPCDGQPCLARSTTPIAPPAWKSWRRVPPDTIVAGIEPPEPGWYALAEMADAPDRRAAVVVELCLDETGQIVHAAMLDESTSADWADQIEHWVTTPAYHPYDADGAPEPVCTELVFEHEAP